MTSYLETIQLELGTDTPAGQVRHQVLSGVPWSPTPTTNVSYVASSRVLVIAGMQQGKEIESRLGDRIQVFIAVPASSSSSLDASNVWQVKELVLEGYLGRFTAAIGNEVDSQDDVFDLGQAFGIQNGLFDHVVDCGEEALIKAAIKPPGYYFVGDDSNALDNALTQIPELIGEFEKPKFFDYNPDICAHGRSGIKGCNRCIEVCPTDAIISIGEQIEVNPHLCQGGGSCTSSCPSGAISYLYPKAEEQIELMRQIVRDLRAATGDLGISVLIYDNEHGAENLQKRQSELPEHIVPFAVEEIGAAGLDLLASSLAYGVRNLFIYAPASLPDQVRSSLSRDIGMLEQVLGQLNLTDYHIQLVDELEPVINSDAGSSKLERAVTFAPIGNKRGVIRSALQFLNEISPAPTEVVSLPDGSIFGRVKLDLEACTLCMGCVSVCPGSALEAGGESPALKFIESNCLQCGICTSACPESALSLQPRFNMKTAEANRSAVLKEEEPFRCISCGKPFATHAMINRMTEKLKGHWMFETPEAVNRLRMCEDCRVADLYDRKDMIG
ncbi:MAG: 4Fe-4S binding protein [Gammaproteobacteria bacterium]